MPRLKKGEKSQDILRQEKLRENIPEAMERYNERRENLEMEGEEMLSRQYEQFEKNKPKSSIEQMNIHELQTEEQYQEEPLSYENDPRIIKLEPPEPQQEKKEEKGFLGSIVESATRIGTSFLTGGKVGGIAQTVAEVAKPIINVGGKQLELYQQRLNQREKLEHDKLISQQKVDFDKLKLQHQKDLEGIEDERLKLKESLRQEGAEFDVDIKRKLDDLELKKFKEEQSFITEQQKLRKEHEQQIAKQIEKDKQAYKEVVGQTTFGSSLQYNTPLRSGGVPVSGITKSRPLVSNLMMDKEKYLQQKFIPVVSKKKKEDKDKKKKKKKR